MERTGYPGPRSRIYVCARVVDSLRRKGPSATSIITRARRLIGSAASEQRKDASRSPESVHRPGRYRVRELPDCIDDPPPDQTCHAGVVTIHRELAGPYSAFGLGVVDVTLKLKH